MNTAILKGETINAAIEQLWRALGGDGEIIRSIDDLPYTEDFERLYVRIEREFPLTRQELWRRLINLRKQGKCRKPS